jgi:hypothetical protein
MFALCGCQTFAPGSLVELALLLREKDFDWPEFLEVKSPLRDNRSFHVISSRGYHR